MRGIVLFLLCITANLVFAQESQALLESKEAQEKLNEAYTNAETSILLEEDFEVFKALEFFPLDEKYIVDAKFIRTPGEEAFEMLTTTERKAMYVKYAEVHFVLDQQYLKLNVYQNLDLMTTPEYEDYLFMPFHDLTNGIETYGGGRYLDLRIPEGDSVRIDFNRTYNPYCVYNPKYSCPIPPAENDLLIEIRAGVKNFIP